MDENYTRWYDKDERLSLIMKTLEHADDNLKLSIAADIIQMVLASRDVNMDDLIDDTNVEYIPVRKRWYDKFETLHSGIEMLKYIDEGDEKTAILKEVINSIIYFQHEKKEDE